MFDDIPTSDGPLDKSLAPVQLLLPFLVSLHSSIDEREREMSPCLQLLIISITIKASVVYTAKYTEPNEGPKLLDKKPPCNHDKVRSYL